MFMSAATIFKILVSVGLCVILFSFKCLIKDLMLFLVVYYISIIDNRDRYFIILMNIRFGGKVLVGIMDTGQFFIDSYKMN